MAFKFVFGAFALATFSVITGNQDVLDWPVILGSDASLYCAPERSAEKHGKTDWVKEAGWHRKEADGTWTWVAGVERHNSTSEWRVKVAAGSRYKKFGNGFLRIQNVSKADNNTMYRCTIVGSDTYMEPFEVKLYVMEAKAVQAVDGGWSSWSEWTDCSVSCGGGVQNRSRTCTNPPPAFGGKLCPGLHAETRECNENHCPVHGNWSNWLDWTDCSLTCGTGGFQNRSRACSNPAPEFGGNLCLGPSTETRPCFGNPCPDLQKHLHILLMVGFAVVLVIWLLRPLVNIARGIVFIIRQLYTASPAQAVPSQAVPAQAAPAQADPAQADPAQAAPAQAQVVVKMQGNGGGKMSEHETYSFPETSANSDPIASWHTCNTAL